jgi:hypothetical protein
MDGYARPADPESTRQWSPFNLDFERVITAVEGDRITVDAPVMCAIERRWAAGNSPHRRGRRVRAAGSRTCADFGVQRKNRRARADAGRDR